MPNPDGSPATAEEFVELVRQQQQAQLKEHNLEVNAIVEEGQRELGAEFDVVAQVVVDKLGPRVGEVMAMVRQMDQPVELLKHLANNEQQLERFAQMPLNRQVVELARIESRMAPHGHVDTSAQPAWKRVAAQGGRVSDVEWKHNLGSNLSDAQWHKEFDRREAAKAKGRR